MAWDSLAKRSCGQMDTFHSMNWKSCCVVANGPNALHNIRAASLWNHRLQVDAMCIGGLICWTVGWQRTEGSQNPWTFQGDTSRIASTSRTKQRPGYSHFCTARKRRATTARSLGFHILLQILHESKQLHWDYAGFKWIQPLLRLCRVDTWRHRFHFPPLRVQMEYRNTRILRPCINMRQCLAGIEGAWTAIWQSLGTYGRSKDAKGVQGIRRLPKQTHICSCLGWQNVPVITLWSQAGQMIGVTLMQ